MVLLTKLSGLLTLKNVAVAVGTAFLLGNISGYKLHAVWVKSKEAASLEASAKDHNKKSEKVRIIGDDLEAAKTQYKEATHKIKTEKSYATHRAPIDLHDANSVRRIEERLSAAEAAVERLR